MHRFGIFLLTVMGGGVVLVVLVLIATVFGLRGSLPPLDGERRLAGLEAPVELARDSLGIAVIRASSRADALRAQGYAHGQDRFFQMDLLRRYVAGRLAAVLGADLLPTDREMRAYGYDEAASLHLRELPAGERALLVAYAEGVNAGLRSLGRRPPEYLFLRSDPLEWRPEDSLLVFLYFYVALSPHYREEIGHLPLHRALPQQLAEFLTPDVSRFDTPVAGADPGDPTGGYRPLPIPGPGVVDLRDTPRPPARNPPIEVYSDPPGGSNAWAIADPTGGPALLANDPHLPIQVPGIWYRVELHWPGNAVRGVSPPGLPGVFIGTSSHLAWGVTAGLVDQTDVVLVQPDPADSLRYLTVDGPEPFILRREVFDARGREADTLVFRETRWGPVLGPGPDGRHLALRSPALDPGGLGLSYLELLTASTVEEGIETLRTVGGPGLSILLASGDGRIAWVVSGVLPERRGTDGRLPVAGTRPGLAWPGPRDEAERPVVLDPPAGRLLTANQRFLPLERARRYSHMWVSPTRARRIAELLEDAPPLHEPEHLALQLDDRSLEHDLVRDLILDVLDPEELDPLLVELRRYAEEWDGTTRRDLPHFRVLAEVSRHLRDGVLRPLLAPAYEMDPTFVYTWFLAHEPAHRILETRPPHLLPAGYETWEEFLRELLREAGDAMVHGPGQLGLDTPWGQVNRARFHHPFGTLHPVLGRFLNLPSDPLPGWLGAVRAQAPGYGQSLRIVVRPGSPETALFQMPGGQSGHFLSRYYGRGHIAWLEGEPAPLAAGPDRHLLRLLPEER